ncbi:MAG: GldG family protein [Gammaproteobacteria bacterium]|nr:GldG family protein [Gammaproteobacteria bacterium]
MIVNAALRRQIRLQSSLFLILFIIVLCLLGWLSQLYPLNIDLSANQRNSLSEESQRLLSSIDKPLKITLFVSPNNENRDAFERLFLRFTQQQPLIEFKSLNPDLYPGLLTEHDIRFDGESLIEYQDRSEKLSQITEANLSTVIQRLLRQGERWLVFLQGHGERNPYSEANHDFSTFAAQLAGKGYRVENLNLTQTNSIPTNTDVLVLASPMVPLLPGEVDLLKAYLENGGNLLWLADPDQTIDGLERIEDLLTVEFLPGIIVDPNSQLLGLDRVDFALVTEYPRHAITQNISAVSLFPQSQGLAYHGDAETWEQLDFLVSGDSSWNETGAMKGKIYNGDHDDEINGPLNLGLTLSASHETDSGKQFKQRIAVVGDADFISNRYLGNGANLDIGVNLVNWLSHDDNLISISPRPAPDTQLELSQTAQIMISFGFLLVLPVLLFGSGLRIWLKRRKQ